MDYTKEVCNMCTAPCGDHHGCAPIPKERKWVKSREIKDISGLTHGVGWCALQQGACKLTLNIKEGIIEEALIETIGCSGMTHSAAVASKARKEQLKVILNGLGKYAAKVISKMNGFTYVETRFEYYASELKILSERSILRVSGQR